MQQAEYNELAEAVKATATRCGAVMALRLRGRRWLVRVVCLILLMGSLPLVPVSPSAGAQSQLPDEYQIKAAFIYNFAQFTEWPSDGVVAAAPFVMCVFGDTAVGDALERAVKRRTIANHSMIVSQTAPGPQRACHLLYVSGVTVDQAAQLVAGLRDVPVLTISDIEGFTESGGIAQFFFAHGQLRFSVRLASAKRARLHISSRLLALAKLQ